MEKKPDFVNKAEIDQAKKYCQEQGLESNGSGQFIYKCGPSEISLPYMMAAYAHDLLTPLQSQLSQVNKYNDQLICAAHDSELKAKESQSQNERLLSALKEWKKLKYSSNGTDWYNFETKVEQLINDSGER